MRRWREVAELWDWDVLIQTDDPERGAKLVTLVLHMVDDTDLVWSSIQSYVWGVRNFMMLQHQSDPVLGVDGWDRFSTACAVLCHVPAEPRRAIPLALISAILEALDPGKFEDAQFGLFMLILLFTFSRSECPCPKTIDGFDLESHWAWEDFVMSLVAGHPTLCVRFKRIKQDRRPDIVFDAKLPARAMAQGRTANKKVSRLHYRIVTPPRRRRRPRRPCSLPLLCPAAPPAPSPPWHAASAAAAARRSPAQRSA